MQFYNVVLCVRCSNSVPEVLLARKRRGHGAGLWNGYGGKVDTGERFEEATIRELFEESRLRAHERDLVQVATLSATMNGVPQCICPIFTVSVFEGEPIATEEMEQPTWFAADALPLGEMHGADRVWLPRVLAGERIWVYIQRWSGREEVVVCEPCVFSRRRDATERVEAVR